MKREIEFLPLKTFVFDSASEALESAARETANWIRTRKYQRGDACIGLPTGDAFEPYYEKIRQMSGVEEKGGLPISGVQPVTLVELCGRGPGAADSLHGWLCRHLLDEWGTRPERRIHLDASGDSAEWPERCAAFEEALKAKGPMDLCLVELGAGGRVGCNEPGVDPSSRTRPVTLGDAARAELDAGHSGLGFTNDVLAAGIGTLRGAKRVRVMAFGEACAEAVERAMVPDPDPANPLSLFVGHRDFELLLDGGAASALE